MLEHAERESIDLAGLVAGCVRGYEQAYAPRAFELDLPEGRAPLRAVPDALVQMLDKLVQNSNDFAPDGTRIRMALISHPAWYEILVENDGAPFPADLLPAVGSAMISGRAESSSSAGHLGLGLFIARIIAEFHGGTLRAENRADGRGVVVRAILAR
jgi:signal transduction histidine kinase